MGYNCYFGEIENQIRDACNEYPPDFEKIERLMEQCEDLSIVSRENPEETMLSDIILWYPETDEPCPKRDGRYLPQIIKLFLKYGFDVSRENGHAGRVCLENLLYAVHDIHIIEAEKILLDAGADPMIQLDGESVIDRYDWESFFQCCEKAHRISNFYHAMVEIARAASQRREYQSIEFFEACIGKRIDKIEMACTGVIPSRAIYNVGKLLPKYKNCFNTPIVFHCEGKQLCVTRYVDLRIDPTVRERAETVCNIEHFFPNCVGQRILAIDFENNTVQEKKTSYNQPIVLLRLDNGRTIRFSINYGEVPREEMAAFFAVLRGENHASLL